jgi:hypothetical protein
MHLLAWKLESKGKYACHKVLRGLTITSLMLLKHETALKLSLRRMRRRWTGMAPLLVACAAWAQSDLPPKVQADIFRQEIVEASRKHEPTGVLNAAAGYRALATQGIQVPPGVLYLEATAAKEIGDPLRAFDALTSYLKVASSSDIYYRDALLLYPLYAADPAVKARAAARGAEPQQATKEKTALTKGQARQQ